ncbi:hypothetical protein PHLCEN_2v11019 [Hermanssonia centrifuga]|uniref:Uncharacterized protein n=1 Tax=Hermanssonia centrifuga TaxID=98765 RepID=A0A2R6NL62_9APHY|nr:hypothetical protein PHLCEN_2v11019 [Hermanssonia centrifuga]
MRIPGIASLRKSKQLLRSNTSRGCKPAHVWFREWVGDNQVKTARTMKDSQ